MTGHKRKYGHDSSELYSNSSRAKPTMDARVDATYGQRSAIPGLDEDNRFDGSEEELNYDDQDALSYLRAVRHEATGIPNLLVAPKESSSDDGRATDEGEVGDSRGWYEDGAYCAAPLKPSHNLYEAEELDGSIGRDSQLAYFDSILSRYETLRAQLRQTPPPEAVARLGKDQPTYLGRLNPESARWWRWKMRDVDPVPAQIASMDKASVFKLLGLLTTGALLKRGAEVQVGVSRWAWALLAKLPDRGELTSEEIATVRELGKKAVLVGMGMKQEQAWEEGMDEVEAAFDEDDYDYEEGGSVINDEEIDLDTGVDMEEGELESAALMLMDDNQNKRQKIGPQMPTEYTAFGKVTSQVDDQGLCGVTDLGYHQIDENQASSEDLAAAKARILSALNDNKAAEAAQAAEQARGEEDLRIDQSAARWNTKATVDMITTIAGEIYGQRDLLEFRQSWGDVGK